MDATIASLNIVVAQPLRLFLSRSKATRRELLLQRLGGSWRRFFHPQEKLAVELLTQ
jgi:hypothetical protein